MSEGAQKLFKAISSYTGHYQSLDIRIMACKTQGSWFNVATQIILESAPIKKLTIEKKLPHFEDFKVLHLAKNYCELPHFLASVESGIVQFEDEPISYQSPEPDRPKGTIRFDCYSHARKNAGGYLGKDYKKVTLRGWGQSLREILKDRGGIDSELQAFNPPYAGIDDLALNFLLLDRTLSDDNMSYIEIIAPTYIRLGEKYRYKDGILYFEIECAELVDIRKIRLGYIGQLTKPGHERRKKRKSFGPLPDGKRQANGKIQVAIRIAEYRQIHLFIKYKNDIADSQIIELPNPNYANPRAIIHKLLDPDFIKLNKLLSPKGQKKPEKKFEAGITALLSLAGFLCYPFSLIPGMTEAADGVAFVPQYPVLLVYECTISSPDTGGKLSKLSKRCKDIKVLLPHMHCLPVLFTALSINRLLPSEMEKAATEGISIVNLEKIEEILGLVLDGKNVLDIAAHLEKLTPQSRLPKGSNF